ncbi:ArsR/SmtB family transcription factor [Lacisediminihabitans sp. FW035]
MHVLDILGDPVRRRLVELLGDGERSSGELTTRIRDEFSIGQPAVSNQLRVLRESGFARSTASGARRIYSLERERLDELEDWLRDRRRFWADQLTALDESFAPVQGDRE